MKWYKVLAALTVLALGLMYVYDAIALRNPRLPMATPTLPPVPQPHPRLTVVECNSDHIVVSARPITCTYTLWLGHMDRRRDLATYRGTPITGTIPQGVPHVVYWREWGLSPHAGQWANVTWQCTMVYPTWEHGPVQFVDVSAYPIHE